MNVRFEAWGAWVRLGSDAPQVPVDLRGALVALDREGALAAGLGPSARWTGDEPRSEPLESHVAVTSRCAAGCTGCYQSATPHGAHVARDAIERTLDDLATRGVFTVAFGGGEPLERDDLGDLARAARARGLVPVVTTSGLGLDDARARHLVDFAQVNVSFDGAGADYEKVRGYDGARHAERAIRALAGAGVRVGVNVVLTRDTFDSLRSTLAAAQLAGAREAQLLRYKPAGRAASLEYLARRLRPEQVARFPTLLRALYTEHAPSLGLRIDCALVPFLSGDAEIDASVLARAGVFGCEAGAALEAVRADGRRAPCSFGPAADAHTTAAIDAFTAAPPEPCASCRLRTVCRGGCRVVAGFAAHGADDGEARPFAFAPDPECPRVRASSPRRSAPARA